MADKKKIESTFFTMLLVLTIVAMISALALGTTYVMTKDAIAANKEKKTLKALNQVLPEGFNNKPNEEKYPMKKFKELICYPAKLNSEIIGYAVNSYSDMGFNERIKLMIGFDKNLTIKTISILQQKETPGLGTKMTQAKFKGQFDNKNPGKSNLKVKKDGGEIDSISAATISSRAFCDAVNKAYLALKGVER